jgi:hypothetical protein
MNIQSIQNLLQHVGIIRQKYDDFAEITGENFNVFDILNLNSNELSHSLFVSYLLDAKGKHGQNDLFLKLFIQQILDKFENEKNDVLFHFQTANSHSKTEKSIGYKSEDISKGGRIDILINDGENNIIIENKIYAGDQEKQLVRYFNYDPNAPLIYLTLGDENPSEDSITHSEKILKIRKDFISISYKEDIKTWIEKCIKAVYDKPLIRETLRQYVYLINELTNQSNNNKMSEEIVNIVTRDVESYANYRDLIKSKELVNKELISIFKTQLERISFDNLEISYFNLNNQIYSGFSLSNISLKNENLVIAFEFQKNDFGNLIFGFAYINPDEVIENIDLLKTIYNNTFQNFKSSKNWPCYSKCDKDFNNHSIEIINGKLVVEFNEIINNLNQVFEEYLSKK